MKFICAAVAAILAGGAAGWFWPAEAQAPSSQPTMSQGPIAMDTPVTLGGVETVCTGIGDSAQHDPRWLAYPVRIEFSNKGAQYLSGAHVNLSTAAGQPLASLDCNGPWVLFQLRPGSYKVTAALMSQPGGGTASASFNAPATGQKRVVLDFSLGPNQ